MGNTLHLRPIAWFVSLWVSACAYLTVNDVETGKSRAYPHVQPLAVNRPYQDVFREAVAAITSLPRWRLVSANMGLEEIRAEVETPLFRFVDDVTVQISGDNPVVVNVRSRSRVGKGDLGKNARNISLFLDTLQQRMGHRRPLSFNGLSPRLRREESLMLEKMKELIRSQDICVLATVAENRPHCSLMAYVTDEDCREIYMVTHRNTAKFRNATENPSVSLLIDTRLEDTGARRQRARALTVSGLFDRIENQGRRASIRARFLERHAHLREFAAHPEAEVFAVKILALQLLDGVTDSYYETVAEARQSFGEKPKPASPG